MGFYGKYRNLSIIIAWSSGWFGVEDLMVVY